MRLLLCRGVSPEIGGLPLPGCLLFTHLSGLLGVVIALLAGVAWAGGPDGYAPMQQQWIHDTVQTVQEQDIPKGELLKQLVLAFAEELGWGKALIWLATLPVLMLAGTVFGVWRFIKRRG